MAYGNGQNPTPVSHSLLKGSTTTRGTQTDSPPKGKAPKLVSLITRFEVLDAANVGFEVKDAQPAHLRISADNWPKRDMVNAAEDNGKIRRAAGQFVSMFKKYGQEAESSGGPKQRNDGKAQCEKLERTGCERQGVHSKVKERVRLYDKSMKPHTFRTSKVRDQGKADDSVASRSSQRDGPIIIANGPSLYSTSPCKSNLLLMAPAIFSGKQNGHLNLPSVNKDKHCQDRPEKQSNYILEGRKGHETPKLVGKQLAVDKCSRIASQTRPTDNPLSGEVDPSIERLRKYYPEETSKIISRSKMQEDNTAMKAFCSTVLEPVKPHSYEKPAIPGIVQDQTFPTTTKSLGPKIGRIHLDGSLGLKTGLNRADLRKPAPQKGPSQRFHALNPTGYAPGALPSVGSDMVWPIAAYIPYTKESQGHLLTKLNSTKKRVRQSIEESEKNEEKRSAESKENGVEENRPLFVETCPADFYDDDSNQVESIPPAYVPTPVFRRWSSPPPAHDVPQPGKGKEKEENRSLFIETCRADFYVDDSNQAESTPPAYVPTPVFRPWSSPRPAHNVPQGGKGKGKEQTRSVPGEKSQTDFYEDHSIQLEMAPLACVPTRIIRHRSLLPPANGHPREGKKEGDIKKHINEAISLQEKHEMWKRSAQMARNARQELRTYQKRLSGRVTEERQKLQAHQERLTRRSRSRSRSAPSLASTKKRHEKTKENGFLGDTQDIEIRDINAMDGIFQRLPSNQEKPTPARKLGDEASQSEPAEEVLMMDVIVAQCELACPRPHSSVEISQMRRLCRTGLKEGQRDESNKRQKTVKEIYKP